MDRLSNKIDMITHYTKKIDPDVVILTEHGLSADDLKNTRLDHYTLISEFSRQNHIKGGVAIYVRQEMEKQATSIETSRHSTELVCELAAIKLRAYKQEIYITGIYRPDRDLDTALEGIENFLETIPTWSSPLILMGDINIDCIGTNDNHRRAQAKLVEHLAAYNVTRVDLPPTRITPHSATSIDMISSNLPPHEIETEVLNNYISDHTGQLCTTTMVGTGNSTVTEKRILSDVNLRTFKYLLSKETWRDVYYTDCVDAAYNNFNETITHNLNLACPYTKNKTNKKKKKNNIPQDPETNMKKNRFVRTHEAYLCTASLELKAEAARLKKEYDLHIKAVRKQQTVDLINNSENKSKAMWRAINSQRKNKTTANDVLQLEINGALTSNPIQIAEHLNGFFVNIANQTLAKTQKNSQSTPLNCTQHIICQNHLNLHPTTTKEVSKIIRDMKTKNSSGFDDISSKTLKICENELVHPLVDIINKSFTHGHFPAKLKLAKVYPKHKQDNKSKIENYRPISLLSTFSKVIEKAMLSRLMDHLHRNNLIPPEQHGFTAGRSTSTAITSIVEYLLRAMEAGDTATALFLDYSKAFDCICHKKLLKKLEAIGVRGRPREWFKSYLNDRYQAVTVNSISNGIIRKTTSTNLPVQRGVPQGSILGPILYIIFVSDFPSYITNYSSPIMYADDTVLLLKNPSPENLEIETHTALKMSEQYCRGNDLVLNTKKSQQMIIGHKKDKVLPLPDVQRVEEGKYLGIILDDKLSWTQHINQLCKKLSSALYVLKRLKQISSDDIVRTAYFALFEAHMRYGVATWGASSKSNVQRVLILQKRAIRILAGLGFQESCKAAFRSCRILTTVSLYILETIMHAQKQDIRRGTNFHTYNTRTAHNFTIPRHRLSAFEKQPTYTGAKFYNILPEEIKNVNDQEKQRKELIAWLLERPFYTTEEFMNWRENTTS